MGKNGDQNINWAQNATLATWGKNDVDIHLFEVIDAGEYIYCGRVELVDKPYIDIQPGEDGIDRNVWIFPIRPVPDNDVKKPAMFVFKDMNDYKTRGKNVDAEYTKIQAEKKKSGMNVMKKLAQPTPITVSIPPKPVVIPPEIIRKQVKHKSYGIGTIISASGSSIIVAFNTVGKKRLGYEVCIKNKLIEFV